MDRVRLGIIGAGGMGCFHYSYLKAGEVSRCEVTAVCDVDANRMESFGDIKKFTSSVDMVKSGEIDAVLIATPHFLHTSAGIEALEAGIHVLVEKPISVHKADCDRLVAVHKDKDIIFAAMFQMRTDPLYMSIKKLVEDGEIGDLVRVSWIVTDWFRTEAYYASSDWRATWKGEGGGVLLNQCPHQLDVLQWLFGMPKMVRAFCGFGMRHNIEVEDQVTAYFEYPNGATGTFITSTGEAPGTSRIEIAGERGKLTVEDGKLIFLRNEVPANEFLRTSPEVFAKPPFQNVEVPITGSGSHVEIVRNFVEAILDGAPLIAPVEECTNSVELANAMLYSSLKDKTIEFPLDGKAYETELNRLISESTFVKNVVEKKTEDMAASFHR